MQNLLDFDLAGLTGYFASLGEKPFRARQVARWIHQSGAADFACMTDLAKTLREKLLQQAAIVPPRMMAEQTASDGTRKWLLDVGGKNGVETVYIPETNRGTLCISTQVGCALDCSFCSTGKQGFNRNLTVAEIIGQLWWVNHVLRESGEGIRTRQVDTGCLVDTEPDHDDTAPPDRIVTNVVMMGMGEPLANYDNTITALRLMLDDNAYGLSRRRVTVSTSGLVPAMDRLAEDCPVALAVSLHAPNDHLRDQLVPINRKYPLAELMAACQRYLDHAPRDFITFEYILIDGVNDRVEHARELVRLTRDVPCKFNLIPFNPFTGSDYRRSSPESQRAFRETLAEAGLVATTRKTRGDDIDAACGQLAGRVQDKTRRTLHRIEVNR